MVYSHSLFPVAAHTVPVDTRERALADSALLAQPLKAVGGNGRAVCWNGKLAASTSEAPLKYTAQLGLCWLVNAAGLHSAEALRKGASPAIRLVDPSRVLGTQKESEDPRKLTELQHGSN